MTFSHISNKSIPNLDNRSILDIILRNPVKKKTHKFIILGRTGPTGKTWLCDKLKASGYNAVELSEMIYNFVSYEDSDNHYLFDYDNGITIVILNRHLKD